MMPFVLAYWTGKGTVETLGANLELRSNVA